MATYAVGDIQGCLPSLKCLLENVAFNSERDQLWVAGDLINRGPDSRGTLAFLHERRDNCHIVLGNHDLHFLAIAYGQKQAGRSDTFDEILSAKELDIWIDWLRHCPLLYHDHKLGFTMSHAGIPPLWTLNESQSHAEEVAKVLRQESQIQTFLAAMYGNQPDHWQDDLQGQDRLRLITNGLTRMRYCTLDGRLDMTEKCSPEACPEGLLPWFKFANRACENDKIVFGHWAALEGRTDTDNLYALDTGCVWGGALSCLHLEEEKLYSCDC